MGFSSLRIQGFRAFEDFRVEGFGNVNLIVGRNNAGKTSLLEALLLITGMSNPGLPVAIHNWRDLILAEAGDFQFMFHNLDFGNTIYITAAQFDGKSRKLKIEPQYGIGPGSIFPGSLVPGVSAVSGGLIQGPQGAQGVVPSGETGGNKKIGSHPLASTLLNKNITGVQLSFTTPEGNSLATNVSVLKKIEPRVQRIDIGTRGMLWVDIGLDTLAPINILGDGFRHIFTILASLYTAQDGVLIIDEIENGLHHSTLEVMWDALLKASHDYNVQVFATTHSYECVVAYADALEKQYPMDSDSAKLFRLERMAEGGHRAVQYPSKVIRTALDQGYEVR